jgi:3-mercaptopyruvate sulfurtransferase SseA
VASKLERLGYTNVRKYRDGIQDWAEAGLPVESSSPATPKPVRAEPLAYDPTSEETPDMSTTSVRVAVAYHSGFGHTAKQAEAVAAGARASTAPSSTCCRSTTSTTS